MIHNFSAWADWCGKKGEELDAETARQQFQQIIDWMKSVAAEKMKTVEGCRWIEETWGIRVEYPPGTPDDQKYRKPT